MILSWDNQAMRAFKRYALKKSIVVIDTKTCDIFIPDEITDGMTRMLRFSGYNIGTKRLPQTDALVCVPAELLTDTISIKPEENAIEFDHEVWLKGTLYREADREHQSFDGSFYYMARYHDCLKAVNQVKYLLARLGYGTAAEQSKFQFADDLTTHSLQQKRINEVTQRIFNIARMDGVIYPTMLKTGELGIVSHVFLPRRKHHDFELFATVSPNLIGL